MDSSIADRAAAAIPMSLDFQRIFESCPHPYLILNADSAFTLVAVSERYLTVTGTERHAIIGRGLFSVFPENPSDPTDHGAADLLASLERVLRDGVQDVMGVQRYDVAGDAGFIEKYWSPVNTPVFDQHGRIGLIIHHVEDVTEFIQMRRQPTNAATPPHSQLGDRMHAEVLLRANEVKAVNRQLKAAQKALQLRERDLAELNESLEQRVATRTLALEASNVRLAAEIEAKRRAEQRFQSLIEFAPSAILLTTRAGIIEMVNAQAEQVFQYAKTELLGQSIDLLIPERLHPQHAQWLADFHNRPAPRPITAATNLYGVRKDGSEFPVEIALNPIETDEGIKVLAAVVDISERKQREESIQSSLKEKVTLLSEVHHRVKNNLQIVSSLLDLQTMQVEDPSTRAMLLNSMNRIQSMALIHQTLYQSNDFATVDFDEILSTLVANVATSYAIDENRVHLSVSAIPLKLSISAAIPCGLIINELVTNALKHAFPAGRSGEIVVTLAIDDAQCAVLSVSDNGVGLPALLDTDKTHTLGLELITILAQQLAAELCIERANPTRFSVRFNPAR